MLCMDTATFGFVYRWTCQIDGKWYVGSHKGAVDDGYTGSGLLFRRALAKHGPENFIREILYVGANYRTEEERILTALNAAADPQSYNLKNQALGVSLPGELNPMHKSNGYVFSEETRRRMGWSRGMKLPEVSARFTGAGNPMFGKNAHAHGLVARGKFLSGKTYDEIFGEEKAAEIRKKLTGPRGPNDWAERVCPHCSTVGRGPNMSRYHFDNCGKKHKGPKYMSEVLTCTVCGKSGRGAPIRAYHFENCGKRKPKITVVECPHCGKQGGISIMKRWHFDRCKDRNDT